jgi:hypothetical protein
MNGTAHRQRPGDRLADLGGLRTGGEAKAPVERRRRPARLADPGAKRGRDAAVEHLQILELLRASRGGREHGKHGQASENWRHHGLSSHSTED